MKPSSFIVEIGTEELPPLSLETLSNTFHDQLVALVHQHGLTFSKSKAYATPRRIAVLIDELSDFQEDKVISKEGPAVAAAYDQEGNPTPAALGFARSCGVELKELNTTQTPKGERLSFQIKQKGLASSEIMPKLTKQSLDNLPIAKAMRWGDSKDSFIRPVKWLLMLHKDRVIPCSMFGCNASNITFGHRFLSKGELTVKSAADYCALLEEHFVVADNEQRKQIIKDQVHTIAKSLNATAVIEEKLLSEVTALVEWPVALVGNFDEDFLSVP